MRDHQKDLYDRLLEFSLDEPGVEWSFARRLARENGWTVPFADRVIVEYKRFLFLAMQAGHVVSPSEHVDQAWHLHLTYTRSYWEQLCRNVLGQPLHHAPTQGGAHEQVKYQQLYAQTLASYERFFGYPPPADIWSDVERRFSEDLQHVTVNTARYWVLPKPRWPRLLRSSAARQTPLLALAIGGLPLLALASPWDLRGPDFLLLYGIVAALALLVAGLTRQLLWPEPRALTAPGKPLDSSEVACLVGGCDRAIDAAVATLVQSGALQLTERKGKHFWNKSSTVIKAGEPLAHNAPTLHRVLQEAARKGVPNAVPLRAAAKSAALEIRDRLRDRGLLNSYRSLNVACVVAGAIMAAPLLLAIPKILIGVARDKPVGYLVFASIVTAILAALMFSWPRGRTAAGDQELARYQKKYAALREEARNDLSSVSPVDMGMLVGLFGASLLASGPLSPLHGVLSRASDGGGCGGAGGDGGCGGGCGGGGCGGCGGD